MRVSNQVEHLLVTPRGHIFLHSATGRQAFLPLPWRNFTFEEMELSPGFGSSHYNPACDLVLGGTARFVTHRASRQKLSAVAAAGPGKRAGCPIGVMGALRF